MDDKKTEFSEEVSDSRQVELLKAVGDGTRLRLLRLLQRSEMSVHELVFILETPQPSVSRHLGALKRSGLVLDRREGTKVYYSFHFPDDVSKGLKAFIEELACSQHPDLDRLDECLRKRAEEAHRFADISADHWDDIGRRLHSSSAAMLALALMTPGRDTKVADLGTGTGMLLPFLSAGATQVVAVDQSYRMLKKARERSERWGLRNIQFIQKSIEEAAESCSDCDAAILHFVLHQVANPKDVVSASEKLLKGGGRLLIVDRVKHEDESAKSAFGSIWLGFSDELLEEWLSEAGFADAQWRIMPSCDPADDRPHPGVFVLSAVKKGKKE